MLHKPHPPTLAAWLLTILSSSHDRDALLGDLEEEFGGRMEAGETPGSAATWYWQQVLRSALPAVALRLRRRFDRRSTDRPGRGDGAMKTFLQDIRHAVRLAVRYPVFAAMVVLTLGLGIAANTIVFSAVDGMVLNPFPYPEPDRLIGIGPEFPRLDQDVAYFEVLSPAEYLDIRDNTRTLEREVAWDLGNRQVTFGDVTDNLFSGFWWGDAFATLGVRPAAGRGFLREEIDRGDRVAILSHQVWESRFGADPEVIGSRILVNGEPYTLVGIMPRRTLIYGTDLWMPMSVGPEAYPRTARQFQVLARMAPGATMEQVDAELRTLSRQVEQAQVAEHPEYEGWRLAPATWQEINVGMLRPAALMLAGAVGFLLLLVCSNVATLLLVRATSRRGELALRTALGAGRSRLLRQLLTESVLLAIVGGGLGVLLGWAGVEALVSTLGALPLPVPGEVVVNARVLGFSLAVSLAAGVMFGIIPALSATRLSLNDELKAEGGSTTGSSGRLRLQRVFVGIETALAVVLLIGGGLLVHSFLELQAVDPGFDTENVLTMRLTLASERYEPESIEPFFAEVLRRAKTIPGVEAAATGTQFPPGVFMQRELEIEGRPAAVADALPTAFFTATSPGYLETLGIPLLRGRSYSESDLPDGPPVVVINQTMAERYFGSGDPIGERIRLGFPDAPWMEIVGVAASTRNIGIDVEPAPEIFASSRQVGGLNPQQFLILRTLVEPRTLIPAVRQEIRELDPDQPIYLIRTIDDAYAIIDAPRRISTVALGLFAAFALILASIGIYGMISYSVGQRRREMGVRIALGAAAVQVRWLVVRNGLVPVALGVLVGLLAAVGVTRFMAGMLYEVSGTDPATFLGVVLLLGLVAAAAAYLPARRLSRLDPAVALRQDR